MDERPADEQIKSAVNNFLWMNLPPTATLQEAEEVASMVFYQLTSAWDEHARRKERKDVASAD